MKRDRINIDKSLIPYKFAIDLAGVTFIFEVRYNSVADLFTIGLYDTENNLICIEPLIYGAELFKQQYQPEIYPAVKIVPIDDSGEETSVTWENLNETVFLTIETEGNS